MSSAIDILFVAGCLANLLKLGDWALRPHQQKWVQKKMDSLVLKLEYTKPLKWYVRARSSKVQVVFIAISVILFTSIGLRIASLGPLPWGMIALCYLILVPLLTINIYREEIYLNEVRKVPPEEQARMLDFRNKYQSLDPELLGRQILRALRMWVWGSKTLLQYFVRPLLFLAIAGVLYFGLYKAIEGMLWFSSLRGKFASLGTVRQFVLLLFFSLVGMFLLYFMRTIIIDVGVVAILSCIILLVSVVFLIIEVLIRILRGIAWRVVEYNKGAVAALVLLGTVVLGIVDFYLRRKN